MKKWEHTEWSQPPGEDGWAWVRMGFTAQAEWKRKMVRGEMWYVGGHRGWLQLDWDRVMSQVYPGVEWWKDGRKVGIEREVSEWAEEVVWELWGLRPGPLELRRSTKEGLRMVGGEALNGQLRIAGWGGELMGKLLSEAKYSLDRIKNAFKQEVHQLQGGRQQGEVVPESGPVRPISWVVKGADRTRPSLGLPKVER